MMSALAVMGAFAGLMALISFPYYAPQRELAVPSWMDKGWLWVVAALVAFEIAAAAYHIVGWWYVPVAFLGGWVLAFFLTMLCGARTPYIAVAVGALCIWGYYAL